MNDLFERAIEGSEEAFLQLLAPHKGKIYRTAFAYLRNEADALDAVQEVIIRTYNHLPKIKKKEALTYWLTKVTINYCLSALKRSRRVIPTADTHPFDHQSKTETLQHLIIQEAIEKLPKEWQMIIFLKYYDGYTLEEIAGLMKKPVGTVKTLLHKALVRLRKEVGQND